VRRGLVWSLVGIIMVAVIALGATIAAGHTPLLGLDLKGGVSVVLQPEGTVDNGTLQQAVTIIERRVNGLGVSNSQVQRQGHDVVIELPGIKDSQAALKVLGETAELFFRPVSCAIPNYVAPTTPSTTTPGSNPTTTNPTPPTSTGVTPTTKAAAAAPALPAGSVQARLTADRQPATLSAAETAAPAATSPSTAGAGTTTTTAPSQSSLGTAYCSASNASSLPTTPASKDVAGSTVILPYYDNTLRYVLGPADMSGNVVKNAIVVAPQNGGGYSVQLTFTGKGGDQFDKVAAERYPYYSSSASAPDPRSQEAIELDGVVESAPTIQAPSFNGTAVISGSTEAPFTLSQANNLALVLRYGSLPVRFTPQSVQTVSATIGKDSLRAGLLAGIGGLVVVMLYMLFYYRALGLVVLAGLAVGGALLYAILAQLSQSSNLTLTLAGVTGIIVAIGITVDSYVVYFERLKDEIRAGRTVRQSTERSFARAYRTVLTADFVSFLAAVILYLLTVGDVRGFAFTLGLSTLLDIVVAYFFIRPMVILVGRRRAFTEARIFGIGRGLGAVRSGGVPS
jgi:preprotein translocase subunit SecD